MSVKSKLSDNEQEEIIAFVLAGKYIELIAYVNTLMYTRGLGSDVCARPFAFRDKVEMEHPCFAQRYLQRILSFMAEQAAREPSNIIQPTKNLVTGMLLEIETHFNKPANTNKG